MHLNWLKSWDDIVVAINEVIPLCETRLSVLPVIAKEKNRIQLDSVKRQIEMAPSQARRLKHNWNGVIDLAYVCFKVAKNMPKRELSDREAARKLANFAGIEFGFLRRLGVDNENFFRDSLEIYLEASLPDLVVTVIAADILEDIRKWLESYYKTVPKDLSFKMNDIVLSEYESHRKQLDTDAQHGLMIDFIEKNKCLIEIRVSSDIEKYRDKWERIYREHIGEPPQPPKANLINDQIRAQLKAAVKTNDPMAVRDVLAPLEEGLVRLIKGNLDVTFDFLEPRRDVTDTPNEPTPAFLSARRQIRVNNRIALQNFERIWRDQPFNPVAKEWYGYALAKLDEGWRQAKEHFEEIRKEGRGDQITDWNIACAQIKLGDRDGAMQTLCKRVESGAYINNALEGAIVLALEFHQKRFLSQQLDWLPCEEAILLGYLFAADSKTSREELEKWLSAIENISSKPKGFEPPDPAEEISPQDLDDLFFSFKIRRMLRGGITWFLNRVGYKEHEYNYLNWRLLGNLYLEADLNAEALRSYDRSLFCTNRAKLINQEVKRRSANEVLEILCNHKLFDEAKKLLSKYEGMLALDDIRKWRQLSNVDCENGSELSQAILVEPHNKPIEETTSQCKEEAELNPPQFNDPQLRLARINNQLLKLKRLASLKGDFGLFREAADTIDIIWPAHSRKLVGQMHATISSLQNFDSCSDLNDKEKFGQELRNNTAELSKVLSSISDAQLKHNAEDIVNALKNICKEASVQINVMRDIEIDWRLNSFLPKQTLPPASPNLPKASILLRITNHGTENATEIKVFLSSVSGKITIAEGCKKIIPPLSPESSIVVGFAVEYDYYDGEEFFSAHVSYSSGGVSGIQIKPISFSIFTKAFSEQIGGGEQIREGFFTGVGIPEDRRDVFRGREREQKRLANSLKGNVQNEVLFLNGPRRVGKTSILNSLKWALPELGLKEFICVDLGEDIPSNTSEYLYAIAEYIVKAIDNHLDLKGFIKLPPSDDFKSEPIAAFKRFCDLVHQHLAQHRILIMVDETQRLAMAVKTGRLDDNVLSLFSTLMSRNSGIMFIFTASVLFRDVKNLSTNPIWGRLVPFAVGFLSADAVSQILEAGVAPFPVKFTPEAKARIWEMTEGHPWIVQTIGKRLVNDVLNPQQRLTVGPADVDQVVENIEKYENQYCIFWWNEQKEEGGFIENEDWTIAKVIIQQQKEPGKGIKKTSLFQFVAEQGASISNERLNKLIDMQTLVKESRNNEEYVRIKGLFLERWLKDHIEARKIVLTKPNVALFVDHENVLISLRKYIEQLAPAKHYAWEQILNPVILARKLAQNADRHGTVISRVAVANWSLFVKDLQPYAEAMFGFDQPLGGKNTSDEKLKQLIRDALEHKDDIGTFILASGDADFRDTIQTLLKRHKKVIIWGFHSIGNIRSNMSNAFRDMESWQNLTIEYLDEILLREQPPKGANLIANNNYAQDSI